MIAGRQRPSSFRPIRLAVAAALAGLSAPAVAEVISRSDVSYFVVEGDSPGEIYHNILERGPRVGGAQAIAAINTNATQDAGVDESGGVCRLKDYVITLDFVITRPRIANLEVLSKAERSMWERMNRFIAMHENEHKAVWQGCAAELEPKILALAPPDCDQLIAQAEALWDEMLKTCDARQKRFDSLQSRDLMQQPFMRHAVEEAQ